MLKHLAKILVSAALLALIARAIDLEKVAAVLRGMRAEYLLPALACQLASAALASARWHFIMRALGFEQGPRFYLASYLKGTFFNQALPTGIGGDAWRVLETSRLGHGGRKAFYGVLLDRVVGLAALMLVNLAANLASPELLPRAVFHLLNAIALGGLAGIALFAWAGRVRRLARLRWLAHVVDLSAALRAVFAVRGALFVQTGLSVAVHLLSMLALYFVGTGVAVGYGLATFLVLVPPVLMLTILPVSLAGWGVRESGMIGLFLLVGADQARVLSMSVLYGLVMLAASLPGLYLFLAGKRHGAAHAR